MTNPSTPIGSERKVDDKKHLVLAGTFNEFKEWCGENGIPPCDARFVRNRFDCFGYTHDHVEVHRVGTYWTHPQYREIEEAISAMHP